MRMYAAAWEQCKKDGEVVLAVHPNYFNRMRNMLTKEKKLDQKFKLDNAERGLKAVLLSEATAKTGKIRFYLVFRAILSDTSSI